MGKAIIGLSVALFVALFLSACTGMSPNSWALFGGQGITVNVDVYSGEVATNPDGSAATGQGNATAKNGGVIVQTTVDVDDGGTDFGYNKPADSAKQKKEAKADAAKKSEKSKTQ